MSDDNKVVVVSSAAELKNLLGPAQPASDTEPAEPVVREFDLQIDGTTIPMRSRAGTLTLSIPDKQPTTLFFVAYERRDADSSHRPLTFAFNGGPGSSSIWLHLGLFGPRTIPVDAGQVPRPPYRSVPNPLTMLVSTDVVFIDPTSTGFSKAADGKGKEFHGLEPDIESVGEFIRRYTTDHGRWGSPIYLAGESYGTTRAVGVAKHIQERYGLYPSGLVLLSVALQFSTLLFDEGNDLPYPMVLPALAATAWYHGRVDGYERLEQLTSDVERFIEETYLAALLKGDRLSDDERSHLAERMSALLGVSPDFILRCNLRVSLGRFCRELLRDKGLTVGRLDSRFTGRAPDNQGETLQQDPSLDALLGPYSAAFQQDLREHLGYRESSVYEILNREVWPWQFDHDNKYVDLTSRLRDALNANPHLRVFVASGAFDLATPAYATDYTLAHLGLSAERRANIQHEVYAAGHMMYIHPPSLRRLHQHLTQFYSGTSRR